MFESLRDCVDLDRYPLSDAAFRVACKRKLDADGALVMRGFLTEAAIRSVKQEGDENRHLAYYATNDHNIYLAPNDSSYPSNHPRNRQVTSSKGCITDDQIPGRSALRCLYDASSFREFLCAVLDETSLHQYADPLSSINLHYADNGQELGWHFDNSSFAITLMIQAPDDGGEFQYVSNVRNTDDADMGFEQAARVLDGKLPVTRLSMDAGALVMFRGQNSMHRVTPVTGDRTRMLVVLAYNTEPGVSLSESARETFYGRLG